MLEILFSALFATTPVLHPNVVSEDEVEVTCSEPEWVGVPTVVNDLFSGVLKSDCDVSLRKADGSVPALHASFEKHVKTDYQVHAGPIAETYKGLKGARYDATRTSKEEGNTLKTRLDIHIASNQMDRLAYSTISTKIEGSGNNAYLKKLDTHLELVRATHQRGAFDFKHSSKAEVQRPWFVPSDVFLSEAKKGMIENYVKRRDSWVPAVAKDLIQK